jgi:hypothetical protein
MRPYPVKNTKRVFFECWKVPLINESIFCVGEVLWSAKEKPKNLGVLQVG